MTFGGGSRSVVLIALSLLVFLLSATTFNSLGQVLPSMVPSLGMSWAEAGLGFTILGIACGAASLAPAYTIRRLGVSMTLFLGAVLLVCGFLCLAAAHHTPLYLLGTLLLGLGYCFSGTVPGVHVISSTFERRSTALGVYFTCSGLGAVFGPLFFYAVGEVASGWRTYWLACAMLALLVGGFAVLVTRGSQAAPLTPSAHDDAIDEAAQWTTRAAVATPQFWIIVAAFTGCLLVNTTVHSFAFQHLMDVGQSKAAATGWISFAAIVATLASAVAGVIGERVDARWLTMASLGALMISALSLSSAQSWSVLALFSLSMGIGLGFSYVCTATLMQDYFGRRPSLELYSLMIWISTSAALGPGLGGAVRDRFGTFSIVFLALAVIDAVLLLAVLLLRRPRADAAPALVVGRG